MNARMTGPGELDVEGIAVREPIEGRTFSVLDSATGERVSVAVLVVERVPGGWRILDADGAEYAVERVE